MDADHSVYMEYAGTWGAAFALAGVHVVFLGYQIWQMWDDAVRALY